MAGMRRGLAGAVAIALVAGLTLLMPASAVADSHRHLQRVRHHAAVLHARAVRRAARVAVARQRLDLLDAQANAALAAYQSARQAADRATAASDAARAALVVATQNTAAARARLAAMATSVYQSSDAGGPLASTLSLVRSGDPGQFLDGLQLLGQLGKTEQAAVDDLRLAEAAQHRSAEIASAAAATALATERGAQTAKQQAAVLVRQQRAEVRHERTLLAHTRAASAAATAKANALARRIQRAEARAAAIRAAQSRALAAGGAVAGCDGSSVAGYPNGRLPTKALCALWGAPGEMLQAAAAASFNRMSHAYASAFSTPLCVTASYRTYERQVELYATMPAGYAAVPGTSNHGWGLAVDLCGGIQVDNSPQHNWLLDHAAAYGWFHPAWAMPGGGGPHEPWHWEFSG